MKHLKLTKPLQTVSVIVLTFTMAILILINKMQPKDKSSNNPPFNGLGNHCQFVNLECELVLENRTFQLSLDKEVETEERMTVTVTSSESFNVKKFTIEGVNMYMGTLPVIEESVSPTSWQGWFMLGSCSEPTMHWQMTLEIEELSDLATLTFITSS